MGNNFIRKCKILICCICTAFAAENTIAMNSMSTIDDYRTAFEEAVDVLNAQIELVKNETTASNEDTVVSIAKLIGNSEKLCDTFQSIAIGTDNLDIHNEFIKKKDQIAILINHLIYTPFTRGLLMRDAGVLLNELGEKLFGTFMYVAEELLLLQELMSVMYHPSMSLEICAIRILDRASCLQCAADMKYTPDSMRLDEQLQSIISSLPIESTTSIASLFVACNSAWNKLLGEYNSANEWGFLAYYARLALTLHKIDAYVATEWIDSHNERTKNFLTAYLECFPVIQIGDGTQTGNK